jgi:hypothetical protein
MAPVSLSPDGPWSASRRCAGAGLQADRPLLVVDASDEAQVAELAAATRVVATTVGPYAKYGMPLVAACAAAGTHYCDLTGEVLFVRDAIDAYQDEAAASGARIVNSRLRLDPLRPRCLGDGAAGRRRRRGTLGDPCSTCAPCAEASAAARSTRCGNRPSSPRPTRPPAVGPVTPMACHALARRGALAPQSAPAPRNVLEKVSRQGAGQPRPGDRRRNAPFFMASLQHLHRSAAPP